MSYPSADKLADAFNLKSSKMLNLFFIYLQGSPGQLGRTGRRFESAWSKLNEVVWIQLIAERAGTHSNVIFECYLFSLFVNSPGNCNLPNSNREQLERTLLSNQLDRRDGVFMSKWRNMPRPNGVWVSSVLFLAKIGVQDRLQSKCKISEIESLDQEV